jgi:hypothetical protein
MYNDYDMIVHFVDICSHCGATYEMSIEDKRRKFSYLKNITCPLVNDAKIIKKSLNRDGQQFHQYQQNEQSYHNHCT